MIETPRSLATQSTKSAQRISPAVRSLRFCTLSSLPTGRPTDNAGRVDQRRRVAATEDRQLAIPALELLVADQLRRQALRELFVGLGLGFSARQGRLGLTL